MGAKVRQTVIELSVEDWEILVGIAEYLDVPRVVILRWALRSYALNGDWPAFESDRKLLLWDKGNLQCGPKIEEPK